MTFENLFEYTASQYEVVLGVLSLTAAVFAAALVYFLLTARSIMPRLRITSYLSAARVRIDHWFRGKKCAERAILGAFKSEVAQCIPFESWRASAKIPVWSPVLPGARPPTYTPDP